MKEADFNTLEINEMIEGKWGGREITAIELWL